jgi:hypothetical protein
VHRVALLVATISSHQTSAQHSSEASGNRYRTGGLPCLW